jgi:hypothetical protein
MDIDFFTGILNYEGTLCYLKSKQKVKFFLELIKYYAMKTYVEVNA